MMLSTLRACLLACACDASLLMMMMMVVVVVLHIEEVSDSDSTKYVPNFGQDGRRVFLRMCACVCLCLCLCVLPLRIYEITAVRARWCVGVRGMESSAFCLQKCLMITADVMLLYGRRSLAPSTVSGTSPSPATKSCILSSDDRKLRELKRHKLNAEVSTHFLHEAANQLTLAFLLGFLRFDPYYFC
uniref:G_PROTEIN_RECEP_F1_2 domain-containing protein n=1 Tax=Elaeophora elaphi TaxID=1147741 RepID=A0A0R3RZT3_9BILA